MALNIVWSKEAKENLENIIRYLEENWSEKEIRNFSKTLEKKLSHIVKTPRLFKKSERLRGAHECPVGKQNSLFYTYDNKNLYIITIFDNRQDPEKLLYKKL